MKTRYVCRIFKIEAVKEPQDGGLDDISEQTNDQFVDALNFQYQIQGDTLWEIYARLGIAIKDDHLKHGTESA